MAQVTLPPEEEREIIADLRAVVEQSEQPEPNKAIILKRLSGVVEFIANAATITAAAPQLAEMAAQALAWAKALF